MMDIVEGIGGARGARRDGGERELRSSSGIVRRRRRMRVRVRVRGQVRT